MLIDDTFSVPGVGTVVSGTVLGGTVDANSTMLLGPDGNGHFAPVQVKSVHSMRVPVAAASAGQSASFALRKTARDAVKRGMWLVHASLRPAAAWEFEAEVLILIHSTTIKEGYEPHIQVLTMRQTARIVALEKPILRTGDRSVVRLRFKQRPEYVRPGLRLIFREGHTKGQGIIKKVFYEQ